MNTTVLFDFDGVIADSYETVNRVNNSRCVSMPKDELLRASEGNIHEWAEEFHKHVHSPACRHHIDWNDDYIPEFEKHVRPFAGVAPVLETLASEHRLIIVSSTITKPIEAFLAQCDMRRFFVEVMGSDVHTSKVEKMRMIFEKYDISAHDCVFITDTLGDMREAKEHNVGAIGVSWGFHPHETLEKGIPFRIVDKPAELVDAVRDYFLI